MATTQITLKHFLATPHEERVSEDFNLKNELQNVLARKDHIGDRIQQLAELAEQGEALLISNYTLRGKGLFGVFVHTDKQNLPLDDSITGREQLSLEDLITVDEGMSGAYIRHFTYFGIKGNSIAYVERQGIKKDRFALHLIHLLNDYRMSVDQQIHQTLPDNLAFSEVEEVVLPPPFFNDSEEELVRSVGSAGTNAAKSLLDYLGWGRESLDDAVKENLIGITLTIRFRRRGVEDHRQELAKTLSALPDRAKLKMRTGAIIHREQVREQKSVRVPVLDERNKILSEADVFSEMEDFLQEVSS